MKLIKIIGNLLMLIPLFVIIVSALVSVYVYHTQLYPLTIYTPLTFIGIIILWFIGYILSKSNKKDSNEERIKEIIENEE